MALTFTCPHCGERTTRHDLSDADVEYVDLGNGLPDALFPIMQPGEERHSDSRLCCDDCYKRAGAVPRALGMPHPYDHETHKARLAQVDADEAARNPSNHLARNSRRVAALTPSKEK